MRDVGPKVPLPVRAGHVLCVGDDWLVADPLAEVFVCLWVFPFESDIFYKVFNFGIKFFNHI